MTADRLDAARDAAALLRTFHEGDREGREILLDYGDTRAIAEVLAAVLHATITATYSGCRGCAAEFVTTWQQALLPGIPEPAKGTPSVTRTEQDAIEAARRPRGCGRCGRTFGNGSAYAVHFESRRGLGLPAGRRLRPARAASTACGSCPAATRPAD